MVDGAEQSPTVGNQERAEQLRSRLEALGISHREFGERTGIDRKTLKRALDNPESTRAGTWAALEGGVTKIEQGVSPRVAGYDDPRNDLVEFTVEGNFGVRAVVKGPIRDIDKLQQAVAELMREAQGRRDLDPPSDAG